MPKYICTVSTHTEGTHDKKEKCNHNVKKQNRKKQAWQSWSGNDSEWAGSWSAIMRWIHLFTSVDYSEGNQDLIVKTTSTLKVAFSVFDQRWLFKRLLNCTDWWHRVEFPSILLLMIVLSVILLSDHTFCICSTIKGLKRQHTDTRTYMINYKSYSKATTSGLVHFEWICHHIQINLTYIRLVYYVSLNKI